MLLQPCTRVRHSTVCPAALIVPDVQEPVSYHVRLVVVHAVTCLPVASLGPTLQVPTLLFVGPSVWQYTEGGVAFAAVAVQLPASNQPLSFWVRHSRAFVVALPSEGLQGLSNVVFVSAIDTQPVSVPLFSWHSSFCPEELKAVAEVHFAPCAQAGSVVRHSYAYPLASGDAEEVHEVALRLAQSLIVTVLQAEMVSPVAEGPPVLQLATPAVAGDVD